MIRVIIADDHTMVRNSLAMFLENQSDIELVAQAEDGEEVVQLCEQHKPDIVLMDMVMPRMNGVEATRAILENHSGIRIIALTSFVEDHLVQDALEAGATSYMLKNASLIELVEAIKNAANNKPTLAPEAAQALIKAARQTTIHPEQLTPREHDVLGLMAEGLINRQIAQQLDLSLSTVKFHVSSIISKLNASGRTEAVSIAIKQNLIDPT